MFSKIISSPVTEIIEQLAQQELCVPCPDQWNTGVPQTAQWYGPGNDQWTYQLSEIFPDTGDGAVHILSLYEFQKLFQAENEANLINSYTLIRILNSHFWLLYICSHCVHLLICYGV